MKLKALKYMRYASQKVQAGEVFEAKAADVRVLLAVKHAVPYVEAVVPRKQPLATKHIAERSYPTPFVLNESTDEVAGVPIDYDLSAASVELDAEPKAEDKPKRAYRRRDMVAE